MAPPNPHQSRGRGKGGRGRGGSNQNRDHLNNAQPRQDFGQDAMPNGGAGRQAFRTFDSQEGNEGPTQRPIDYEGTAAHQWNRQFSQPSTSGDHDVPFSVRPRGRGQANGHARHQTHYHQSRTYEGRQWSRGNVDNQASSSQTTQGTATRYQSNGRDYHHYDQQRDYYHQTQGNRYPSEGRDQRQHVQQQRDSHQYHTSSRYQSNDRDQQRQGQQEQIQPQQSQMQRDTFQENYSSLIAAKNQGRNYPPRFKSGGSTRSFGASTGVQHTNGAMSRRRQEPFQVQRSQLADTATQRERLTDQLTKGVYECMVCCESVRQDQAVWSCVSCYHVFHMTCVRKWARTSQDESGQWRCPGCQSISNSSLLTYLCFCTKRKNPEWNRREIPHSCGEVCGKRLGQDDASSCSHNCTLLCHPGPCPSCAAQTVRKCPCGKTSRTVKCGSSNVFLCEATCDKTLSCGVHQCQLPCHAGQCEPCQVTVEQTCFCSRTTRQLPCSLENSPAERFECGDVCQRTLDCGEHHCQRPCHAGQCDPCPLKVDTVLTCPCGKVPLEQLYQRKNKPAPPKRTKCTDPVPTCGQTCGKGLSCGHQCAALCHEDACPPCPLTTTRKCRCGRNEKTIACVDLSTLDDVLCERRCNKKRKCGRHKCIQVCCIDQDHICMLVCGRQLSCGLHRCEALCHAGNCARCYRVSFDELTCHCGANVTYPPVPCGSRPPECNQPCTRERSCGHDPQHSCHPEVTCPPCTWLCEKQCYGGHELRKNVPCHLTEVSCGRPCAKPLPCGRHTCPLNCHDGACPTECSQPCPIARTECPHPCNAPCHQGPCPSSPCREKVKVQCQCGQRTATVSCEEQQSAFRKLATGLLATKMTQLQLGEAVDFKDLLSGPKQSKSLECNEECALVERNRRLALALQIKNPNPKPGAPRYPDSLKDWVKKDARFAQMVHDKLTELVQLAKQSVGKMRSRSYSFDPMNRDKRQFVHDYCVFFGCETASYDEEPKRNVVATAYGETSFLPGVGVVEVTQREMGQRKMPGPPTMKGVVLTSLSSQPPAAAAPAPAPATSAWGKSSSGGPFRTLSEVVRSSVRPAEVAAVATTTAAATTNATTTVTANTSAAPYVDYFDFTS